VSTRPPNRPFCAPLIEANSLRRMRRVGRERICDTIVQALRSLLVAAWWCLIVAIWQIAAQQVPAEAEASPAEATVAMSQALVWAGLYTAALAVAESGLEREHGLGEGHPWCSGCALVEAGFTLHHCARHHRLCRLGGVCLLPVTSGPGGDDSGGIVVSWTTHDLLSLDWDRWTQYNGAHEVVRPARPPVAGRSAAWQRLARSSRLPLRATGRKDEMMSAARQRLLRRRASPPK
jgi:hypothetical protein